MTLLHLRDVDFSELYTLLELYENTYQTYSTESARIRSHLLQCYCLKHGLNVTDCSPDIFHKISKNPRDAGRKKSYNDELEKTVLESVRNGTSIRETARLTGLSAGTVQRIKNKNIRQQMYRK